MWARLGFVRGLIVALFVLLLLVPVGVERRGELVDASVGDALAELAGGKLGVGLLSGFVEGGSLARASAIRVALASLAAIAFWLTFAVRVTRVAPEPPPRRRRCPACLGWVSEDMNTCPGCNRVLYVD